MADRQTLAIDFIEHNTEEDGRVEIVLIVEMYISLILLFPSFKYKLYKDEQ